MINPNAYYTVQGWMREELGLKGNALAVYAIIYGFSQDGASEYAGSARYLADWLGCDKKTVLRALADLTEKGHLIKRTTYQNGITFCNYVAARNMQNTAAATGDKITPPGTNCPKGGEKLSLPPGTNCPQGGDKMSSHNTRDNTRYINKDINIGDAGAPPTPPEKKKKAKVQKETPPKIVHGHFQHVLLTEDEYAKLVKTYGQNVAAAAIRYLDEYMEDKPKYKSASHYLAIRRWVIDALNEKARKSGPARPAARGGYPGAMVGPNGIAIDPSKNDLDGQF